MSKAESRRKKANKFEILVAKVAYILFMVSLIILVVGLMFAGYYNILKGLKWEWTWQGFSVLAIFLGGTFLILDVTFFIILLLTEWGSNAFLFVMGRTYGDIDVEPERAGKIKLYSAAIIAGLLVLSVLLWIFGAIGVFYNVIYDFLESDDVVDAISPLNLVFEISLFLFCIVVGLIALISLLRRGIFMGVVIIEKFCPSFRGESGIREFFVRDLGFDEENLKTEDED